jgi:heat shock protein HtpX
MNRQELEGVLAHEMSHIEDYDIRFTTLVVVLVGTIVLLSDFFWRSMRWGGGRKDKDDGGYLVVVGIVLAILAPIIAQLIQLAVSRQREYLADMNGARLTRNPEGLASALTKLEADTEALSVANKATAHLYIVNPLHDVGGWLNGLFDTHPPIEERIRRLRVLEGVSSSPA